MPGWPERDTTLRSLENRVYFWSFCQNVKKLAQNKEDKTSMVGPKGQDKEGEGGKGKGSRKGSCPDGRRWPGALGAARQYKELPVGDTRDGRHQASCSNSTWDLHTQPPILRPTQSTEKGLEAQPHLSLRFSESPRGVSGQRSKRVGVPGPLLLSLCWATPASPRPGTFWPTGQLLRCWLGLQWVGHGMQPSGQFLCGPGISWERDSGNAHP